MTQNVNMVPQGPASPRPIISGYSTIIVTANIPDHFVPRHSTFYPPSSATTMVSQTFRNSAYSTSSASSDDSSPPSSPSKRASLSDVANIFVKMRHLKERSKSHHIVSSSGDRPQTHASLQGAGTTSGEQIDMELNDVYNCSGAVDTLKLLRASRSKLMQQAKYLNGNVLLDEQCVSLPRYFRTRKLTRGVSWHCTIRGPKNQREREGKYRVHVSRFSCFAGAASYPSLVLDTVRGVRLAFFATRPTTACRPRQGPLCPGAHDRLARPGLNAASTHRPPLLPAKDSPITHNNIMHSSLYHHSQGFSPL